jgi:hypothetical protein
MIPPEQVPDKADSEVWMLAGSTYSRRQQHFHTERDCIKLRQGGDDREILTPTREEVTDTDGECAFCDESVAYPENDREDMCRLANKMKRSDSPRQVLEEHYD